MNLIPQNEMCQIDSIRREIDKVYRFPFYLIEDQLSKHADLPLTDLYETEDEFIVSCDLPSLRKQDDVTIHVQDDQLMISGILVNTENNTQTKFSRAICLPENVSSHHVRAVYQSGALNIYIQKNNTGAKNSPSVHIEFYS